MSAPDISLRPATAADRDLLAAVYASGRDGELAAVPFSDAERAVFLAQQFHAQSVHYESHYPGATLDVVVIDGEPAGRLYVHRRDASIHVMEIGLLPACRGRGVGERLLRDVLAEAAARGVKVTINVEPANPARRLYERLGFRVTGAAGEFYVAMEVVPSAEHGLVARAVGVRGDRDEEDVERAERRVNQPVDALGEPGIAGAAEGQPERGGQPGCGGIAGRAGLGQDQLDLRDREAITDQRGEVLDGGHAAMVGAR
jgi:ribosomal protein S18 acetylase RimI-like enzyme